MHRSLITDLAAEKVAKWIGDGLRRERNNSEFRGARVEVDYTETRDGDRTQNEIVLVLSNGKGYRMKVQPFRVSLISCVETPKELELPSIADLSADEAQSNESESDESESDESEAA